MAPGNPDDAARVGADCPVVVKGYLAHLGTTELVAWVIDAAIKSLVQQPLIKAVGFTGNLRGGRAPFGLCSRRAEPIPFFGELGLFNPLFFLPHAVVARGAANAAGWVGLLTMEAVRHQSGYFCGDRRPGCQGFCRATQVAAAQVGQHTMLTDGIAAAFRARRDLVADCADVLEVAVNVSDGRKAMPAIRAISSADWLRDHAFGGEVFGPMGFIVRVRGTWQKGQPSRRGWKGS